MSRTRVATLYVLFAIVATGVNLLFQFLSFQVYAGDHSLAIAIGIGTLAGLITKYVLDKRWIFHFETQGAKDDARKFLLYTLMGVMTTGIFWGTEALFDAIIPLDSAKYLGATVGLAIGYMIKYQLDKRFVFRRGTF